MWIIGVDGGGTKCKASLFDSNGRSITQCETGSANLFADFDSAINNINAACNKLILNANNTLSAPIALSDCFLSLGCAGAKIPSVQQKIINWPHHYAQVALTTDIHISCLAANNQKDCALIITGTGSCIAIYQDQEIHQYGGHGFLLGDIASGAWLGKNAVSWYLRALESKAINDPLVKSMAVELGDDVVSIVQNFGHAKPVNFAQLMPCVLSVKDDSEVVKAWIQESLQYLHGIITEHCDADTDIFIHGGIAHVYKQGLALLLNRDVATPQGEAVDGAYAFAMQFIGK
jgi:glucosamine kinase